MSTWKVPSTYLPEWLVDAMTGNITGMRKFIWTCLEIHPTAHLDSDGTIVDCAICLLPLDPTTERSHNTPEHPHRAKVVTTNICPHAFHAGCFAPVIKHGNTCPLCRARWYHSVAELQTANWINLIVADMANGRYDEVDFDCTKEVYVYGDGLVFSIMIAAYEELQSAQRSRVEGYTYGIETEKGRAVYAAIMTGIRCLQGETMAFEQLREVLRSTGTDAALWQCDHRYGSAEVDELIIMATRIVSVGMNHYIAPQSL